MTELAAATSTPPASALSLLPAGSPSSSIPAAVGLTQPASALFELHLSEGLTLVLDFDKILSSSASRMVIAGQLVRKSDPPQAIILKLWYAHSVLKDQQVKNQHELRLERVARLDLAKMTASVVRCMDLPEINFVKDGIIFEGMALERYAQDLLHSVRDGGVIEAERRLVFISELMQACSDCHLANIIHCSLAPRHIVLCDIDIGPSLKLCDFASWQPANAVHYRVLHDEKPNDPFCFAPEMFSGDGYGAPLDYWALGWSRLHALLSLSASLSCRCCFTPDCAFLFFCSVIYFIWSGGEALFSSQKTMQEFSRAADWAQRLEDRCRQDFPVDDPTSLLVADIIRRFLYPDPRSRQTASSCLHHPALWSNGEVVAFLQGLIRELPKPKQENKNNLGTLFRIQDQRADVLLASYSADDGTPDWRLAFSGLADFAHNVNYAARTFARMDQFQGKVSALICFWRNCLEHLPFSQLRSCYLTTAEVNAAFIRLFPWLLLVLHDTAIETGAVLFRFNSKQQRTFGMYL